MAISSGWNNEVIAKNHYNEYKNCFETQEGIYKLIYATDLFCRDKETHNISNVNINTPVMLSMLHRKKLKDFVEIESFDDGQSDIMCVNFGKELFVYPFDNYTINQENNSPIDKRLYKSTFPTCHDFNTNQSRAPNILLIVGFTGGQIQLIDPLKKDHCKLFNEERNIEKTAVTCIKWVPNASNQFLVSYASGYIYLYSEDLLCGSLAPSYQVFKQVPSKYCISTCKTKSSINPLYRWEFDSHDKEAINQFEKSFLAASSPTVSSLLTTSKYCAVNNFGFSPITGQWIAIASQDGFLRIFDYNKMDYQSGMRSYFGGIICLDWSPDEKFLVTGGQDDLVTIWSLVDQVVICRCQGHKSWVSMVKFDTFMSPGACSSTTECTTDQSKDSSSSNSTSYRFGSVGQDTLLCLWELTEDVIRQALLFANNIREKSRLELSSSRGGSITSGNTTSPDDVNCYDNGTLGGSPMPTTSSTNTTSSTLPKIKLKNPLLKSNSNAQNTYHNHNNKQSTISATSTGNHNSSSSNSNTLSQKFVNSLGGILGGGGSSNNASSSNNTVSSNTKGTLGSDKSPAVVNGNVICSSIASIVSANQKVQLQLSCPRLEDVPILEPIVSKHVSADRLTDLMFREEALLCTCQQGQLYAWTRPGYTVVKTMSNTNENRANNMKDIVDDDPDIDDDVGEGIDGDEDVGDNADDSDINTATTTNELDRRTTTAKAQYPPAYHSLLSSPSTISTDNYNESSTYYKHHNNNIQSTTRINNTNQQQQSISNQRKTFHTSLSSGSASSSSTYLHYSSTNTNINKNVNNISSRTVNSRNNNNSNNNSCIMNPTYTSTMGIIRDITSGQTSL